MQKYMKQIELFKKDGEERKEYDEYSDDKR